MPTTQVANYIVKVDSNLKVCKGLSPVTTFYMCGFCFTLQIPPYYPPPPPSCKADPLYPPNQSRFSSLPPPPRVKQILLYPPKQNGFDFTSRSKGDSALRFKAKWIPLYPHSKADSVLPFKAKRILLSL